MATAPQTIAFFLEQLEGRDVSARKMFGEYGIFSGGKMVAMICDDTLFVKPLAEVTAWIGAAETAPPYPGAKPQIRISAERWEDRDWLAGLIGLLRDALPAPKPRAPRKPGT